MHRCKVAEQDVQHSAEENYYVHKDSITETIWAKIGSLKYKTEKVIYEKDILPGRALKSVEETCYRTYKQ